MNIVRLAAAVAGASLVAAGIAWAATVPIGSAAPVYVVPLANPGTGQADTAVGASGSGGGGAVNITQVAGTNVPVPGGSVAPGTLQVSLDPASPGINPNGQTTSANSTPVVLPSDQVCSQYAVVSNITSATDTQIVAQSGTKAIYVCDYELSASAADNVYLEKATTGTCATLTRLTPIWYLGATVSKAASNAFYRGLNTGASAQLCIHTSSAGPLDVGVYYAQY